MNKLDDMSLRLGKLEEASEEGRRQRTAIFDKLSEIKELLGQQAQLEAQLASHSQADITRLGNELGELRKIVAVHEGERQRAKGAKTVLAAGAAAIGGAAGGLASWFK